MAELGALDAVVRNALTEYVRDAFSAEWRDWYGKEHDHVNRFALGYLLKHCNPAGPLRHPTQLGLGVALCQPTDVGENSAARKDLVIWPEPGMTCWSSSGAPSHHPLALLEWKVRRPGRGFQGRNHDRAWLSAYARWQPKTFVGYAVALDLQKRKWQLWVERFEGAEVQAPWLRL